MSAYTDALAHYKFQSVQLHWNRNELMGEIRVNQHSNYGDAVLVNLQFDNSTDAAEFADYGWYAIVSRGGRKIATCQITPTGLTGDMLCVLITEGMTRYAGKCAFQLAYGLKMTSGDPVQWRYTNAIPMTVEPSAGLALGSVTLRSQS